MKNNILHNSLILIAIIMVSVCFSFSVKAANSGSVINKGKISFDLMQKAKNAILSGNQKQAENYWLQAKTINPSLKRPTWFEPKFQKNNLHKKPQTEEEFIRSLQDIPYEKAKIELDKKLMFYPNNTNLRIAYLELALKNNDEKEASRHRSILGIKPEQKSNMWLYVKYLLMIIIIGLIAYELKIICKSSITNNTNETTTSIKSL